MNLDDISLCRLALIKIGANSISSFSEGTTEALVSASLYPVVRDGLISSHPWNFAIMQTVLPSLSNNLSADYKNVFQLPPDCLRVISAGHSGRGRGLEYAVRHGRLFSDADNVRLTYITRVEESLFPAFFSVALIARLAAEFCIPLTDSTSRWKSLYEIADTEFRRAKLSDAQEDSPPRFEDFPLINGRG